MQVFTYAERSDLSDRTDEIGDVFPEFIHHADVTVVHWHRLREELPELQLVLYDDERDAVVGRGQTIPASTANGLPGGVDRRSWPAGRGAERADHRRNAARRSRGRLP